MERLLEPTILKEVFRGDEFIGGFQEYVDRVRYLHHRFLEACLVPESTPLHQNVEEMLRFAEDAEFLATQYTNPLVVERVQGLPIEDVPSRQIVQDALALAGTIFEFLGDAVAFYESQDLSGSGTASLVTGNRQNEKTVPESELSQRLGRSALLYLKSALCYGLGLYESRTQVILGRVLENLAYPKESLTLSNFQQWADFLVCALLSRNLREISRAKAILGDQTLALRAQLRQSMALASSPDGIDPHTPQSMMRIEVALSLIDASLQAADAFLQGESSLIEHAQSSLSNAIKSAYHLGDYELLWLIRTSGKVLAKMWADSPWVRLADVMTRQAYLRKLVEDGIVTLWSSQIAALDMRSKLDKLKGGYLDERIKRVIVHMPTSAGKTLLAELAIAHQSFLSDNNKCVYVAPYRALCDQVAADLGKRLSQFGIQVTSLVSDSDITEYESILFRQASVLVVTPEKLGYLFRQRNQFVQKAKLFIFDELHNIGKADRGWDYEELISLLLQHPQTSTAKMIFLSAVMPNHVTVQEWVDPTRLSDTISEPWQPTRLLKGAISFRPDRPSSLQDTITLSGDLIYVRHKGDMNSPLRIRNIIQSRQIRATPQVQRRPRQMSFLGDDRSLAMETSRELGSGQSRWTRDSKLSDDEVTHAVAAAGKFVRLGPVLVYSPSRGDAVHFCNLALNLDLSFVQWRNGEKARFQEIVEFVRDRLPPGHGLADALERRIAFHHAGLPRDVRNEIEYAFQEGWIRILAATTTLVEGVNLPVKTLILSDYCQKRWQDSGTREWKRLYPLSESDFSNIAGRAGRALYETEGQVIFIQSIDGYPYASLDTGFDEYLSLGPDSSALNISSTLADDRLLEDLGRLVEEVDNGKLSEQQLLFEIEAAGAESATAAVVNKLHAFTLLLQDQGLVGDDEESFVRIFQGTFLGKQRPDQAPQIAGAFSHRSARAMQSLISQADRALFAQTGLKIPTCRTLMERVRTYWDKHGAHLHCFLNGTLDYSALYDVAELVFGLGDRDVDPIGLTLAPAGKGSKTKQRLEDDHAFFADWILTHDTQALIDRHFAFIKDLSWRAEQYVLYTQQTLGYRAPWTLSAFWLFSKAIVAEQHIDLGSTIFGRELLLLPAYAKFGVNSPAAALSSTLGVSPSVLARQLGEIYEEQYREARYDYLTLLRWLVSIEPVDLEALGKMKPAYIRRLTRILASLKPLEKVEDESHRVWQVDFPIAGWQYYGGDNILQILKVGDALVLRHERDNRYDPSAMEILTETDVKLGYVPRYLAPDIRERYDFRPITVTISEILPVAPPYNKVHVHCVDKW